MTKRSKRERAQRTEETERIRLIETSWAGRVPAADARAFAAQVESVKAMGPRPKPADMAPGTAPNPPRPGREPKPPKETGRPRRGR